MLKQSVVYINALVFFLNRIETISKLEIMNACINASDKHQMKKKENRFVSKPPLKDDKNIEYAAGYRFEDHKVSRAAEFDAIQNERDSALTELEDFDSNLGKL